MQNYIIKGWAMVILALGIIQLGVGSAAANVVFGAVGAWWVGFAVIITTAVGLFPMILLTRAIVIFLRF